MVIDVNFKKWKSSRLPIKDLQLSDSVPENLIWYTAEECSGIGLPQSAKLKFPAPLRVNIFPLVLTCESSVWGVDRAVPGTTDLRYCDGNLSFIERRLRTVTKSIFP